MEATYYSRQLLLPEVGEKGQKALGQAKCLVIGAGGLGSSALLYLAAAGIGTIGICDGDRLEESNLHRQPLYARKDIGHPKAVLAAQRLENLNPMLNLHVHPFRFENSHAVSLFSAYDLVLDCTDNFKTKFLINDAAYLCRKPLVRASIYQFEGQIQTYLPERHDACLRCLWEEVPSEGCVGTCQEVGVLGPVPGLFGILQALEAIKFFLKMPTLKSHEILFIDLIHHVQRSITFDRKKTCPLCGDTPSILSLDQEDPDEIEFIQTKEKSFTFIDIREPEETHKDPYLGGPYLKMPMSSFDPSQLKPEIQYALFCQRGRRSLHLVQALRQAGIYNVVSLRGGMEKLRNY